MIVSLVGTIVKWSKLDKLDWKKASTVVDKTSEILGRLYRYKLFQNNSNLGISFFLIVEDEPSKSICKADRSSLSDGGSCWNVSRTILRVANV